jgi:hypothetical protein
LRQHRALFFSSLFFSLSGEEIVEIWNLLGSRPLLDGYDSDGVIAHLLGLDQPQFPKFLCRPASDMTAQSGYLGGQDNIPADMFSSERLP